jgi:hypothetical protein
VRKAGVAIDSRFARKCATIGGNYRWRRDSAFVRSVRITGTLLSKCSRRIAAVFAMSCAGSAMVAVAAVGVVAVGKTLDIAVVGGVD